jgi:hypothetical protein
MARRHRLEAAAAGYGYAFETPAQLAPEVSAKDLLSNVLNASG